MGEKELIQERWNKFEDLQKLGIAAHPYSYPRSHFSHDIKDKYDHFKAGEKASEKVCIAGRLMAMRLMGKAGFGEILDESGRIQFYISENDDPEQFKIYKKLDIGDIIGIKGLPFKTKVGELTIHNEELTFLCKCLRPLPEKFHGLKDIEIRYRKRPLDLFMNPEIRSAFRNRSKIISFVRNFLDNQGFLEVEIPTLQVQYGGANAKPFITHINAWDMPLFLSISPELHLKRLVVGGLGPVYTITKCFRNEGADQTHNPEFTMMECYLPYSDFSAVMKIAEDIVAGACQKIHGTMKIKIGEHEINLAPPWKTYTMIEAIKKFAEIDVEKMDDKQLKQILRNFNIEYEGDFSRGLVIAKIFEELVEDKLIQPTHITEYPQETCPLAKPHRSKPGFIERFESYLNGAEILNGYSELNDARLQKLLFQAQEDRGRGGDEEFHPMDMDYVETLELGMPPTGGLGIGIDRITTFLLNQEGIRDVILFPTMKPEKKD